MNKILTSLVALFTIASVQAQEQTPIRDTPKLVIGITIDQLRGDYLKLFQQAFTLKGFKRLINEGVVYQNIKYNFPNLDNSSAEATIYTGSNPFYHKILGKEKYLPQQNRVVSTFFDDNFLGNYTQDKLSPLALQVTTITDELKAASHGQCNVYALAPDAEEALIGNGHEGNGAYWIDNYTGKWASSTYFKNFYSVFDNLNRCDTTVITRIPTMTWEPLLSPKNYFVFPFSYGSRDFSHHFGTDKDAYIHFKQSPFVNQYIENTACQLIKTTGLGKHLTTDFLSLSFYAGGYPETGEYSAEIQDTYIRLDQQLAAFLDYIDKNIGLKNTLIFLASSGYFTDNNTVEADQKDEKENKTDKQNIFYPNRCQALLNMYLMALYGNGDWVNSFTNNQIYLNRDLITKNNIPLDSIQTKAADFVSQFTGIQQVYTSYQLLRGEWNPVMQYYKNGFSKGNSGDLFVEIQPGYKVIDPQNNTFKPYKVRNNAIISPVIFFGNNLKPQKIKRTIKATEIASTVSYIMRIRAPSAASNDILEELF